MNYTVNIYKTFDPTLQKIWSKIENKSDHYVFQCHDWLSHWYQTVGINYLKINPFIIIVSDNNKPIALFPFGIRKCLGAKVLEFLGGDQSDYKSPLITRDYVGESSSIAIWEIVKDHLPKHDIQQFLNIPQYINQKLNPVFYFLDCKKVDKAYSVILPETWNLYYRNISKKIRSDSRRQIRRLAEKGDIQFIIGDIEKDCDKYFENMFRQKSQRFRDTGARDIFDFNQVRMFYRGFNDAIMGNCRVHFSALLVDDEILATHWGVVYLECFYYLLPTYDTGEWKRFSTGRLLQEKILEWSIEEGLGVFDFTIGGEGYKKLWCNNEMDIYSTIRLKKINGLLYYIINLLNNSIKKNKISRKYFMGLNKIIMRYTSR